MTGKPEPVAEHRQQWAVTRTEPGTVHVIPIDDLIGHDLDTSCPCIPVAELVPGTTGPDGWVLAHSSLDGREANE